MKQKLKRLSQRYVTALRKHLQPGPRPGLEAALGLGRLAVALGLETLELAPLHERALARLKPSSDHNGMEERVESFLPRPSKTLKCS
jgi:hypothetical protein